MRVTRIDSNIAKNRQGKENQEQHLWESTATSINFKWYRLTRSNLHHGTGVFATFQATHQNFLSPDKENPMYCVHDLIRVCDVSPLL